MSESIPFEDAAELRTNISGWVCKTCRRFYGEDERTARYCCAGDLKCGSDDCNARIKKGGYIYCDPCLDKRARERWLKLEEASWDGETPLVLHDDDRYFFSEDDLTSYLEEHDLKMEDVCLVICEKAGKPIFEMYSFLDDYLAEGMEHEADWDKIDKIVNDWIDENVPTVWLPGDKRPTLKSLVGAEEKG